MPEPNTSFFVLNKIIPFLDYESAPSREQLYHVGRCHCFSLELVKIPLNTHTYTEINKATASK